MSIRGTCGRCGEEGLKGRGFMVHVDNIGFVDLCVNCEEDFNKMPKDIATEVFLSTFK